MNQHAPGGDALLLILAVVYFIPALVALKRKHNQKGAITALNLLLGWSGIGWIIALVWAMTKDVHDGGVGIPAVLYRTGDIVRYGPNAAQLMKIDAIFNPADRSTPHYSGFTALGTYKSGALQTQLSPADPADLRAWKSYTAESGV